jgi:hypothetical protein
VLINAAKFRSQRHLAKTDRIAIFFATDLMTADRSAIRQENDQSRKERRT